MSFVFLILYLDSAFLLIVTSYLFIENVLLILRL
ncbi:hypothetical protein HMPREF1214_03647 [Bacteroides sp. HPS0048]|nr:hypothetical protein HMPREF1214_03647 [Bacteroides sp. HPS0048]